MIDNPNCTAADEAYANWLPNLVAASSVSVGDGNPMNEEARELTDYGYDTTTGRVTKTIARARATAVTVFS